MASQKRINTIENDDVISPTKQWKENPPGAEQKALENMFKNGEITELDTPNSIRMKHPMFQNFTAKIFGVHFRKIRAKHGFGGKS